MPIERPPEGRVLTAKPERACERAPGGGRERVRERSVVARSSQNLHAAPTGGPHALVLFFV